MESAVSIDQFQEELQTWKHELSSFKQEIRHFEKHLEKLSAQKLPKERLAQIEHFQNSFICQKEVIDKLRHDLPDSPEKVETMFKSALYPDPAQHRMDKVDRLTERMDIFRRLFEEVRADFKKFEAEFI